MKIESILKRDGGTVAEINGVDYHFAPQADGAHVAEIDSVEHVERFLAIPEGYRIYRETEAEKPARRQRKAAETEEIKPVDAEAV